MHIFYDASNGQVVAIHTYGTTETTWSDRGYVGAEVPAELLSMISKYARDCRVTVDGDGNLTGCEPNPDPNPPTPKVDPHAALKDSAVAKLIALGLTPDEANELL
jgi:hypothetical protein